MAPGMRVAERAAMKKVGGLDIGAGISLILLFYVVVVRLQFAVLPLFFLALGFITYAWNGRRALVLFLFLLPLVNSTPDLFFNGYPYNYMGIPLFYLSGVLCASRLKKEEPECAFPGRVFYSLFLALLGISVFFVFLRWSNLGLPGLALLRDTPVAPSGERVSFACIFPAITLALFALSPFLAFLIRQRRLSEREVFVPLKAGFYLSFLLVLVQKWVDPGFMAQRWWGLKMNQLNGGFSDFNAFGFFAGALFLYQALKLLEPLPQPRESDGMGQDGNGPAGGRFPVSESVGAGVLFLAVALAAIFISGCRTAFLFVLAAVIALAFSRKVGLACKAAVVLLLAGSLFIAGGTLGKRLHQSAVRAARLSAAADLYRAVDKISTGRLEMLRDGARMTRRFPVSGVGAGNFLFYLKYLRFGKGTYLDLPLNQYLLFFSEIGLPGGLAFIFFMAGLFWRQRPGTVRSMLAVMAFALLFNNFFWFPEVLLLFWIFVARTDWPASPALKKTGIWPAAVILCFAALNIIDFQALHPRNWARETSTPYDYGFSYP
jgi:O-antigen ligase